MQYRVTKGKSFTADNEPIPVGTILEFDEVPAFLVGKVEPVPEGLEATAELDEAKDEVKTDPAASIKPTDAAKK